jgi:hypothetical protein
MWQISFSVTIFLGMWFASVAFSDVKEWTYYALQCLRPSPSEYQQWIKDTALRLGSRWSVLVALPFMAAGLAIAFVIARNSPSSLFPFPGFSPVFIYAVFIEFCIAMLYLLGATGYWLLYTLTISARALSRLSSIDYTLVDGHSLQYLSNIVLRLCFLLMVIIGSAMPGVAYVVFSFGSAGITVLGTTFGMALPTVALALCFFGPTYYLHNMLVTAKNKRIKLFKDQIRLCEDVLKSRVEELSHSGRALDSTDENLVKLISFLRESLAQAQNEPDWPWNLSSLIKLSGSSMIPVAAFFAQEIIRRVF